MLIVAILLAGLRWRLMWDTASYLNSFYHIYPSLKEFSLEDYPIGKDPLFVLLNSMVKTIGGRFYVVQLIHAAFVNILIFNYFKKHCHYIFTCLLFYALVAYFNLSMEVMRASMSIVICLYANDYILEKKWIKAYLLLFIALMFHVQTLLIFIVPFLYVLRFNKIGVIFLLSASMLGYILQGNYGSFFELLALGDNMGNKISAYAESDYFGGQGGNLNNIIVHILPNLLYTLGSLYYIKRVDVNNKMLKFEPLVMIGLVFLFMQISLSIVYRFVDYYVIYFILFYSEVFVEIARKPNRLSKGLAYVKAIMVFFPFFISYVYSYIGSWTICPYSSVIERRIDKNREDHLMETNSPGADRNEY